MPAYTADIRHILTDEEVKAIVETTKGDMERAALSCLWITGARPSELVEIKRDDCEINTFSVKIIVTTKKLRKGKFLTEPRTFLYKRDVMTPNHFLEIFARFAEKMEPGKFLFSATWDNSRPMNTRTLHNIVARNSSRALGGLVLCPYNFRHSFFTRQAEKGRSEQELRYMKGAADTRSVSAYVHIRPITVEL